MNNFPWLPIQTKIEDGILTGRVIDDGSDYQILETSNGAGVILLIRANAGWLNRSSNQKSQKDLLSQIEIFKEINFDDQAYLYGHFDKDNAPAPIENLIKPIGNSAYTPLMSLSNAISEMTELFPDSVWNSALFLRREKICVATEFDAKKSSAKQRQRVAMRLLVGAIEDTDISPEIMRKFNPNLNTAEIREFLSALNISDQTIGRLLESTHVNNPDKFSLPGRPELEQFFRENVIDYFHRYSEYQAMGILPPNGILIYGPPGTGKTYSVKALADFLGWKVIDIDIGSIGSPYIHQTSRILKEVFEKAAQQAPSIVLMEEIDALGGSRSAGVHEHKIEEIAQLLRLIETASKQGILVIGTTNRYHSMDEAIVRRGRFDHVIELGLPKEEEIHSALAGMLKGKPIVKELNLAKFAHGLSGHPMSDVAWAVNEAAKAAVRNNKTKIDDECLELVLKNLDLRT